MAHSNKLLLAFTFTFLVSACTTPTFALSENQQGSISQGCNTIRQSFKLLRRSDSHARTYLGSNFEAISSNFITPLNLYLIKNNQPHANLLEIQTSFATARTNFHDDFITYSRSLEALINLDCQSQPAVFYQQLLQVRQRRSELQDDIAKLKSLATQHYEIVNEMVQNYESR